MKLWSGTIYVRTLRSDNPYGFGGVIFFGYHVNERGEKLTPEGIQVHVPSYLMKGCKPEPYQFWEVTGTATVEVVDYDGYETTEIKIIPNALTMTACSGGIIREILENSDRFRGIGKKKSTDLWGHFRDRLYDVLDEGDIDELKSVLTGEGMAEKLISAWSRYADGRFISYLQKHGFPAILARKFLDRHGEKAQELLEDDPYRLLSYSGSWRNVDQLARSTFGISRDDPKRLAGAVEEALYSRIKMQDTAATPKKIEEKLKHLLFVEVDQFRTQHLVTTAMTLAKSNGAYLVTPEGYFQTIGPYIMESTLANRITEYVSERDPQLSLLLAGTAATDVDKYISAYEKENKITLTGEQRAAVHMSVDERFSIITGGAGTGKTMVLKCIYYVLAKVGYGVVQMALAGKAAKRMREATGKESHTIAGFLNSAENIIESNGGFTYYVIDEASMVDLKTAYRLFQLLPKNIRMIMVGDPYQLPPIGAGLVFHKLVDSTDVPKTQLSVVKRQDGSTGIPLFAAEVRKGSWPTLSVPGVKIEQCDNNDILTKSLRLLLYDKDQTQIICAVRNNVLSGVYSLNDVCQTTINPTGTPIRIRGVNGNLTPTKFRQGDRIIFTRNDWDRGVMNGSMGIIIEALDAPEVISFDDENPVVGTALVDGVEQPIFWTDVAGNDPILDHGYAVTCHKAQGSQFKRVIVPIHRQIDHDGNLKSRMLDLTWVYTALTRAEVEVVFVGCEETIRKAVAIGPKWHNRVVGFDFRLIEARNAT